MLDFRFRLQMFHDAMAHQAFAQENSQHPQAPQNGGNFRDVQNFGRHQSDLVMRVGFKHGIAQQMCVPNHRRGHRQRPKHKEQPGRAPQLAPDESQGNGG